MTFSYFSYHTVKFDRNLAWEEKVNVIDVARKAIGMYILLDF